MSSTRPVLCSVNMRPAAKDANGGLMSSSPMETLCYRDSLDEHKEYLLFRDLFIDILYLTLICRSFGKESFTNHSVWSSGLGRCHDALGSLLPLSVHVGSAWSGACTDENENGGEQ